MKKYKWICNVCNEEFKTKKELIEHLKDELSDAEQQVDISYRQMKEELGVKDPYED